MQAKLSQASLMSALATMTGVGGDAEGAKIALFRDETPITPQTDIGELTEASFTGYARSAAVVYGTIHMDDEGNAIRVTDTKEFKVTVAGPPQEVNHVVLANAAGDQMLAWYTLDEPLIFTDTNDVHRIAFPLYFGQPGETPEEVFP